MAVIFNHDIWHEGTSIKIIKNDEDNNNNNFLLNYKSILRSGVMFE